VVSTQLEVPLETVVEVVVVHESLSDPDEPE
jgi:hypothetical protein